MDHTKQKIEMWDVKKLMSDYVREHARDMPEKVAINYYGRKVSFKELNESSDRLANAIADMGYKKGDRVAVFLQTSPQVYISYLSALRLGLIIVPIDPMSKEFELEYALNDSGASLVIAFDQFYPIIKNLKDKVGIRHVILTSFNDYLPENPEFPLHKMMHVEKQTFPDTYDLPTLIGKYSSTPPKVNINLNDYAWILYTGGTTGYPKGCLHTQYAFTLSSLSWRDVFYEGATKEDIVLLSWPHTHVSGITFGVGPLFICGLTVVPLARWDALAAMQAIDKYKVTIVHWTVPQYPSVIDHPENKNYDLTSLRVSIYVSFGMVITDNMVDQWKKLTRCHLRQGAGYGSSEHFNYGAVGNYMPTPHPPVIGSGYPLPGFEVKIMDFDTREELPVGEVGEIVTKSPCQIKEYWNKPEESRVDIIDGWLHMHDRGYVDREENIYFLGKKAEIVKVSGYNVALKEVEMVALKNPAIDRIAVIALPHPKKGNQLKAFVTLKPDNKATNSELEEWFNNQLAAIKCPVVEIRGSLPTSGKGEILKRVLLAEEQERSKG